MQNAFATAGELAHGHLSDPAPQQDTLAARGAREPATQQRCCRVAGGRGLAYSGNGDRKHDFWIKCFAKPREPGERLMLGNWVTCVRAPTILAPTKAHADYFDLKVTGRLIKVFKYLWHKCREVPGAWLQS